MCSGKSHAGMKPRQAKPFLPEHLFFQNVLLVKTRMCEQIIQPSANQHDKTSQVETTNVSVKNETMYVLAFFSLSTCLYINMYAFVELENKTKHKNRISTGKTTSQHKRNI